MRLRSVILYLISFTALLLFILAQQEYCRDKGRLNGLLDTTDGWEALRAMGVTPEQMETFGEWAGESDFGSYEYLCSYLLTETMEREHAEWYIAQLRQHKSHEFQELLDGLEAVWADAECFPVLPISDYPEDWVDYVDSWMFERTYGGKRGHEGTDLMAGVNERGRYPVVSITDGVVEQVGWLPLGGWRIGIRSPHGGYFYYAHMYDYAQEFQPGDTVQAGELLGFMGDSGYGEEGTVGQFAVHLHVGIYINREDGTEISVNPYALLRLLED